MATSAPEWRSSGMTVSDRAMTMLAVVPNHQTSHPATCGLEVSEGQARVDWRVLERVEEGLGVRVVVAHVRSAGHHSEWVPSNLRCTLYGCWRERERPRMSANR
jgi:hypothetical protein